jgi:hypothetical protein
MMRNTYLCDGCGSQLSDDEVEASRAVAVNYNGVAQEEFCKRCALRAPDYWKAKADLLLKIVEESNHRLINHRNKFFS